jgi:hypothetical protein
MGNAAVRNGDLVVEVLLGVISFYRVESNGTRTLLTGEFKDTKAPFARNYVQDLRGNAYQAQFSFSADTDEMFFGTGQQACCKDHSVNKKGQVVDFYNYNSHVTLPVWMSNKVCLVLFERCLSHLRYLQGYLMYVNYPGNGRVGMAFSKFINHSRAYLAPAEFNPLKTRFVADETTIFDYYM